MKKVMDCMSFFEIDSYTHDDSDTHYYLINGGSSSGGSSHYGRFDGSPHTIAKNNPDWYWDYCEYGENPDNYDYLESEEVMINYLVQFI